MSAADPREARLLNDFQRGFPLVAAPYAAIAERLGTDERWVRETLAAWRADGRLSRVGAVFRPGSVGVSTLAAVAVPEDDLARVAAIVSARREVNHNYEREHRFNLWFVATAADPDALAAALAAIARDTGHAPIALPLIEDYWIDLGFDLAAADPARPARAGHEREGPPRARIAPSREEGAQRQGCASEPALGRGARRIELTPEDRRIVDALAPGLPLTGAPWVEVAATAGVSEAHLLTRVADWLACGVISRLGLVVRHRALGYTANAMCVWDVPDADVGALGRTLAAESAVTLCYRRARALPAWRYNLYCMIHGRDRALVDRRIGEINAAHGLARLPAVVLYSRRAFKQRGARYALAA